MSDATLRQIRVLHVVSAGGVASSLQQSLFMPLLTRLPRPRVKSQVACLSPGAVPSAVLRQNGVPVFDLALSRKRFSPGAVRELVQAARLFRPDVIQAWGHTAQIVSAYVRGRCDWKPRLVWSIVDTTPLAKNAGVIDRQKLKYAARFSARADRIVYTSESAASQHRRVGFPDGDHVMIPPGVDATRFKPDFAARRKLREQLNLPGEALVLGMVAPFQPEYDHSTLIKAVGELIKVNPNIAVVLAGHGVQKGNAPLMALVGGGALATRVHLLGEWSDISALYNACDVVCSSALNDQSRMNLVMAMLCGIPCVATGIGAQGEVIGQHGVAIEPGSPAAFVKGINRIMQLTPEKRTHMAQGARKHALESYIYVRSLQKYLQLYYDLIGRQSLVTQDLPTPEVDAALTLPPALPSAAEMAAKRKPVTVVDLSDPDSLESKVTERQVEDLPKWRQEQEQERSKREAEVAAKVAASKTVGDVLQVFEREIKPTVATPMTERARGVADDSEELLSPELLTANAPQSPRVSRGPSGSRNKAAAASTVVAPQQDAAKQAALKAARMAALQPIAIKPKAAAAKPASATSPVAAQDISSTQPLEMLSEAALLQPVQRTAAAAPVAPAVVATAEIKLEKVDPGVAQPPQVQPEAAAVAMVTVAPVPALAPATLATIDISATQPLQLRTEIAAAVDQPLPVAPLEDIPTVSAATVVADGSAATPVVMAEVLAVSPAAVMAEAPAGSLAAAAAEDPVVTPAAVVAEVPAVAPAAVVAEVPAAVTPAAPVAEIAALAPVAVAAIAPGDDFGELSLMATGAWPALQRSTTIEKPDANASGIDTTQTHVLNGPETLSLIAGPAAVACEPTLQLALLPDPDTEPKRAANGD